MSESKKLWGGRFAGATASSVEAFTASIHYDSRLYKYDIQGSKAHAKMLASQGLLTKDELQAITDGLSSIEQDIDNGTFEFKAELEDIHMNIEKALVDRIGPAGAKLHSARSRNDQIALDFRMYLRDQCDILCEFLDQVRSAFVVLARKYLGQVMPGYTHLQRAQPVLISHHMLAYFEMFGRDRQRFEDCRKRLNYSPLGCAAMAGTGLPIDREMVAEDLGFDGVTANSMDTSGDRDFAIEFASCCTITQLHLSRLSEELVMWASQEFSFVEIADQFCTGSSIMPQKKNPDIPELIRGKSGRVVGSLMSLITLVKGLPLTYNRDLQEDKEPLFDTVDTVGSSLSIMAELLANLRFKTERMEEATKTGFITATDLADYLVLKNVPFRDAHGIVGRAVAVCIEKGCELIDLTLEELQEFSTSIEKDVFEVLSVEGSVNSRISTGGTSITRVEEAVSYAEKTYGDIIMKSGARIAGAFVVAGSLIIGGCGFKNKPVPPESVVPRAIEDLRYKVDEAGVTLSWSYPMKTIAGTEILDISSFEVYRAAVSLEELCPTCPVPFDPEPIEVPGGVTVIEGETARVATYKSALLSPGNKYFFKVRSRTSWWADSADSNIVSFVYQIPPNAPVEVKASPENENISLSWQPVTQRIDGSAVEGDVSYLIMRSEGGENFETVAESLTGTAFLDENVTVGKTYYYKVQSQTTYKNNPVSGAMSKVVSISPIDKTPPAVVEGVKAVETGSGIKVFWNRLLEKDLAGYNIYRKIGAKGKYEQIGTVLAIYTTFEDKQVPAGKRVYYAVSAFDSAKPANEGPKSAAATTRN